jgi:hypothetical protein
VGSGSGSATTGASCHPTGQSGNINTNNNRRDVGPLQAIAPGPAQAIVFTEPLELALQRLQAGEVTAFMLAQCRSGRRGVAWSKRLTSGLRSLLRYLHVAGWVPVPLAQAVPSVAGWPRCRAPWRQSRLRGCF